MKIFLLKFTAIIIILSGVILWIESSPAWISLDSNSAKYVHARWNSLYDITEERDIDILIMGNSRIYNGINPNILSVSTNSTSFILGAAGTSVKDAYFSLKEILKRTTPKLLVVETYCMGNYRNTDKQLVWLYKSFNAKKDLQSKVLSTPHLFEVNNWPMAWSNSIRNHNYIFDEEQDFEENIKKHKDFEEFVTKGKDKKYVGKYNLFLGKFNRQNGISKENLARYESEGPPADASTSKISDESKKYTNKLNELCKEKGIELMFLTIPVYYKHIANYDIYRDKLDGLIQQTDRKWLNLQTPYDTTLYTPDCFENTFEKNQHTTAKGSYAGTKLLSKFIKTNFKDILVDRSKEKEWNKMFYNEYTYLYDHKKFDTDKTNVILGPLKSPRGVTIEKLGYAKFPTGNGNIWAQVKNTPEMHEYLKNKTLQLVLSIVDKEKKASNILINIPYSKYFSDDNYIRHSIDVKKFNVTKIVKLQYVDNSAIKKNAASKK